jgi:hypothetical protein
MTGSGTALDPYIIWDVNDLQAMGNGAPYAPNANYELGVDIDATATATWNWNAGRGVFEGFVPIAAFTGNLNGRYHRILHLYMDRYNGAGGIQVGLWGDANGGTIQNLYITDATVISYNVGAGHPANHTGVLIGSCGTCIVRRVIVRGTVHGTNNDTTMWGPNGNCNIGGMVGLIWGGSTFDECASYANVLCTTLGWAVGYSGGFVGNIQVWPGHFWNCYSRGNVAGGNSGGFYGVDPAGMPKDNCYSTGTAGVGGFGAVGPPAVVTDSFWDLDTSGIAVSAGGVGRHTPQMKTEANYTAVGWDFVNIWHIDLTGYWNDGYPYFVWDAIPTIQVASPNGGENWLVGSTHTILWVHTNDPGANVMIELLRGGVPQVIVASTPIGVYGGGNYNWTIDPAQPPDTDYRVRISSTTTPVTDTSDNDFTISAPAPPLPAAQVVTLPATEVR